MSKLADLITELCLDGVEYKKLSELFNTRNGYTPSKSNASFWENGTIPWFRMEDIRINGGILIKSRQYISKEAIKGKPFPANSIIISTSATIGEHALVTVESLANQRFTNLTLKENFQKSFIPKFLYYYCFKLDEYCISHTNKGNFLTVDMNKLNDFMFPLPPLPVQSEIVRILDTFTELTAELTARRKQYEYYSNKLLTFGNEIPWKKLGDTCDMNAGKAISSLMIYERESPSHKVKCYGGNGIRGYVAKPNTEGAYPIIGRQGALCGNVKYTTGKFYATEHAVVVKSKGDYIQRFLYYLLKNINLNQYKSRGAQPGLAVNNIEKLYAPLPPLEEQARIVSILDRFDKLCNDLTQGLPAEIEARKKQYAIEINS